MRHHLCSRIATISTLSLLLTLSGVTFAQAEGAATQPAGQNATGTWSWTQPGRGGNDTTVTLKLKQDGDKVTGTMSGGFGGDTDIQDGTFKDGQLTFKIVRDFNGQSITTTYAASISGDSLTGKSEMVMSRSFNAKKSKD